MLHISSIRIHEYHFISNFLICIFIFHDCRVRKFLELLPLSAYSPAPTAAEDFANFFQTSYELQANKTDNYDGAKYKISLLLHFKHCRQWRQRKRRTSIGWKLKNKIPHRLVKFKLAVEWLYNINIRYRNAISISLSHLQILCTVYIVIRHEILVPINTPYEYIDIASSNL